MDPLHATIEELAATADRSQHRQVADAAKARNRLTVVLGF
jgi:hypothetical protein